MNRIHLLDDLTANQIAAGEVVERPASVAKELLENAVDAGASAITLEIRDGGISYLRVTDNGSGILPEDCKLAFSRHATSKIRSGADLGAIATLGFRGEALPSIASVSKVELTTRTKDGEGMRMAVEAGQITDIRAAGAPQGTTIVVKDLFFNTPARRKFLRRSQVEGGYVADAVAQLALSRPDIAVRFVNNSKTVYQTTGNGDLKAVIYMLHGKDTAAGLVPVSGSFGTVMCEGYVGVGAASRGSRAYEFFFLNGRFIKNPELSAAVETAVSEQVMVGRFPYCVLNVRVPLDSVDVNVHPNKLEVRFKDAYPIRDNLREILLESFPRPAPFSAPPPATFVQLDMMQPQRSVAPEVSAPQEQSTPPVQPQAPSLPKQPSTLRDSAFAAIPMQADPHIPWQNEQSAPAAPQIPPKQPNFVPAPAPQMQYAPTPVIIGQLFDTYLLVQLGNELVIIDQHAAHERILYEHFRQQLGKESLSQTMLAPYSFTVSPKEEALLQENMEYIEQLGFSIEPFGPRVYRVTALPFLLGQPSVQSFIVELIDRIDEIFSMKEEDLKRETLIRMACHKAIKGGDKLGYAELKKLLAMIESENIPLTCPHGRPILMRMSKHELERKFGRIQ